MLDDRRVVARHRLRLRNRRPSASFPNPTRSVMSAESRARCGLIFGLVRIRSSTFICIQINAAMQVTEVRDIQRTIIPFSEIGRSVVDPALRSACESAVDSRCNAGSTATLVEGI